MPSIKLKPVAKAIKSRSENHHKFFEKRTAMSKHSSIRFGRNCKTFIVRHAYKYAHYHSSIRRQDMKFICPAFSPPRTAEASPRCGRRYFPDFIFARREFIRKTLEGVHDDDCDIKIKINSIQNPNILLTALRHIAET